MEDAYPIHCLKQLWDRLCQKVTAEDSKVDREKQLLPASQPDRAAGDAHLHTNNRISCTNLQIVQGIYPSNEQSSSLYREYRLTLYCSWWGLHLPSKPPIRHAGPQSSVGGE